MTNIAKHADASRVDIQIRLDNNFITVTVADNGEGFNLEQLSAMHAAEKGMGLAAMQERVLMLGSFLDISTRPGEGTRLHFDIPREEEASV